MPDAGAGDGKDQQGNGAGAAYEVLARRRRPQDFDALIGQEAMVRVLTNAFDRGRLPHAIMLTGVRGVGKTTTARIIAKGLNCETAEGPTVKPCGHCKSCVEIAESRHVDVLEMDAASRTGIDDIREIIDSVRYRAAQARHKVYIIDEVHMLSKSAFNGLLKTLEEPPEHVTFILATTDIHKVPVTVLSRCMRFDLRRVPAEAMIPHLTSVAEAEGVTLDAAAVALLARVSEGSMRDALSLLDQAIAHAGAGSGEAGAAISDDDLRGMLGMAERGRVVDLFDHIMAGDPAGALTALQGLYQDGADPAAVLRDLGDICHLATVAKAAPARLDDPALPPAERDAAARFAEALSMRALGRAWQMILKAIDETARAPSAIAAAEMAVLRMTHVSELPGPEEILRRLGGLDAQAGAGGAAAPSRAGGGAPQAQAAMAPAQAAPRATQPMNAPAASLGQSKPAPQARPQPAMAPTPVDAPNLGSFDDILALAKAKRDGKLSYDLETFVRPGPVAPGRFEFTPTGRAPEDLAARLADRLSRWTGRRWIVSIADGHGGETAAEQAEAQEGSARAEALAHPLVQAALQAFPGAELIKVTRPDEGLSEIAPPPPPEDDDLLDDGFDGDWEPDPGFD